MHETHFNNFPNNIVHIYLLTNEELSLLIDKHNNHDTHLYDSHLNQIIKSNLFFKTENKRYNNFQNKLIRNDISTELLVTSFNFTVIKYILK